ncbi:MAG: hypothetical protein EXR72_05865 [Myxococcales bacterium]|nr:hypothetical protein [Myxococcales bacterium]
MRPVSLPVVLVFALFSTSAAADDPPAAGQQPPPPGEQAAVDAPPPPPAPPVAAAPAPAPAAGFSDAQPPAEKRIPDWRFVMNSLTVFRFNPLGIETQLRAGFQRRLVRSYDTLFRDTFVHFGIYPKLNPAFVKIGPSLEIQPLSILNVRVAAEYINFFSTFGFLQSFPTPLAAYNDTQLSDNVKTNHSNYATSGFHVMIEPLVQIKVGPIALRNKLMLEYWRMNIHSGDTVWYDATLDTLVPGNGWVLANDLDLLFVTKFRLTVGARYSLVKPFYKATDFQPGEETGTTKNGHMRVGGLAAYTFFDRGFTRFNKPTVLVILSWYVQSHYRTGTDPTNAGIPYVIVAFAFQSDLMK